MNGKSEHVSITNIDFMKTYLGEDFKHGFTQEAMRSNRKNIKIIIDELEIKPVFRDIIKWDDFNKALESKSNVRLKPAKYKSLRS